MGGILESNRRFFVGQGLETFAARLQDQINLCPVCVGKGREVWFLAVLRWDM